MTDQQTSRTSITEALHELAAGWDAQAIGAGTYTASTLRRCARNLRERLAALAAEPRSDAVTAQPNPSDSASPDEPSTEAGRRQRRYVHAIVHGPNPDGGYECGDFCSCTDDIIAIEREARAASASVPPLDEDALLFAVQATNDVLESRTASMAEKRDRLARAYRRYAAETPEQGSSQRSDRKNLSTYQAETPEQGRGDE